MDKVNQAKATSDTGSPKLLASTMDPALKVIAEPTKHFQKYNHEQRADRAASHRLGYRQKHAVGEAFWTHPAVPGIAFPTRKAALQAAWRLTPSVHEFRKAA